MKSIIIVDDHQLFAKGVRHILQKVEGITILAMLNCGNELLRAMEWETPSLVTLDIQMPGISGLEVCREVKMRRPECKVVFISMFDDPKTVQD